MGVLYGYGGTERHFYSLCFLTYYSHEALSTQSGATTRRGIYESWTQTISLKIQRDQTHGTTLSKS